MILLSKEIVFPNVALASPEGIVAFGGDLSPERLTLAYKSGIFPWFTQGEPIIWYSPDPRMVLYPERLKISKSMRKILRERAFQITFNKCFKEVISNCKTISRNDQHGTWITDEMKTAYIKLHEMGVAKSVEVWKNKELVGGLYGIDLSTKKSDLGSVFCGESMFSKVSNASKVAFIHLVQKLQNKGCQLIDCQVYNNHLASLGAEEIPRKEFLRILQKS
jgi:leucyl/phenylalanyl-tRNA--protein transferase